MQKGIRKYFTGFTKMAIFFICLITFSCLFFSCSSKSESGQGSSSSNSSYSTSSDEEDNEDENNEEDSNEDSEDYESEGTSKNSSGCKLEDGTYSATVDYNNSETGYTATYTLDVEVQDCQVIQIDFPNGGYLDEDHISYADIDEDGNASVDGEDGKTYEIHIDN